MLEKKFSMDILAVLVYYTQNIHVKVKRHTTTENKKVMKVNFRIVSIMRNVLESLKNSILVFHGLWWNKCPDLTRYQNKKTSFPCFINRRE